VELILEKGEISHQKMAGSFLTMNFPTHFFIEANANTDTAAITQIGQSSPPYRGFITPPKKQSFLHFIQPAPPKCYEAF
jgi:hypothetical protein